MKFNEFVNMVLSAMKIGMGRDYDVNICQVTKNNDVVLHGLVIKKVNENIAPTIYLEPFFAQLEEGESMANIIREIREVYDSSHEQAPDIKNKWNDFETLKDQIVYKLISQTRNEKLLSDVPYTPFLDLAIVYYILLESNERGQMAALIHNEHLQMWDVETEELHRLATENTKKLLPVSIHPIMDLMVEMVAKNVDNFKDAEDICEYLKEDEKEMDRPLFVLSNTSGMYGAACILYDGVVERFAMERGTDVIILPSSVHETLLLGWSQEMDFEELQQMVQNVNGTMMTGEDILSEHVYVFKREDGVIRMAI